MLSPDRLLPLKPEFFHILLALNDQDLHGYAIIKEIEAATNGRMKLEPSPLYRRLKKLTDEGVIREAEVPPNTESGDERRRYYGLTPFGRQVMAAEAARVVELATNANVRNLAAGV
jgi:DNA-binding PadR family transcriptional regulator